MPELVALLIVSAPLLAQIAFCAYALATEPARERRRAETRERIAIVQNILRLEYERDLRRVLDQLTP